MKHHAYIPIAFLVITPLVALSPLAQVGLDWLEMQRVASVSPFAAGERGYDWAVWKEHDGLIRAEYVYPGGPAWEAGLRRGDVFHELDHQQYFTAEDLQQAIQGIGPGRTGVYSVLREENPITIEVPFTRDATFLYPLSPALWQFTLWGFALGAFLHVVGLIIVAPLAVRSRRAAFSLALIFVSSAWLVCNLLRVVLVELLGPPSVPGGGYDVLFRTLTFAGLAGWLAFPTLLLHKVLLDSRLMRRRRMGIMGAFLYLPATVLAICVSVTTIKVSLGPLTLNTLVAPILFYTCCYIAAAAALMFVVYLVRPEQAEEVLGRWNRTGSLVTLILSVMAALAVLGLVSIFHVVEDVAAGWLIVSAQLLSLAPVVLVSHATLQHGKVDLVVRRGLVYAATLGLIFFAFVGGMSLIQPYLQDAGGAAHALAGLYVVILLLIFGGIAQRASDLVSNFFATERQQGRKLVARLLERMRSLVNPEEIARDTADTVGRAFGARSAAVFLRPYGSSGPLVSSTYHPEPPYITERLVSLVWPHLKADAKVWASNSELNERSLNTEIGELMRSRGVVLAVPIMGDEEMLGLLVLGQKRRRRAVYNLEDVDVVRSIATQLALAIDRLTLVERERALIRESAEAHLVALRAQINPHFLFNALNTIASLISERPDEAEATVERLAATFRHTLKAGSRAFVTLEEEFTLVSDYLEIEKARFGEKLQTRIHAPLELRSHPVPAFAVQTLTENAVKHGLEKCRGAGAVEIIAEHKEDVVEITVSDTGAGIPALFDAVDSPRVDSFYGMGLRNVAARLEQLYGRTDLLHLSSDADRGTTAVLKIPAVEAREGRVADLLPDMAATRTD